MALSILKDLLRDYVQSLINEGIVDDRFSRIQCLINFEQSDRVFQLINKYFNDVEISLSEFTALTEFVAIDFSKLKLLAQSIEEGSAWIGANHVKLASMHLIQACDEGHPKNIAQALSWINHEFSTTKKKLEPILQMLRRITKLVTKKQT